MSALPAARPFRTVERKMLLGAAAFVVVFVAYLLMRDRILNHVKINGDAYRELKGDAAMLMDLVQPRLFVLEPYSIAHELMEHAAAGEQPAVEQLVREFERLRLDNLAARETYGRHARAVGLAEDFAAVGATADGLMSLLARKVISGLPPGGGRSARQVLDTEGRELFNAHRLAVQRLQTRTEAAVAGRERAAEEYATRWRLLLTSGGVALVLSFVAVGVIGFRSLVFAPVREAVRHFQRMAGGDYSRPVRTLRRDEFGEMLTALEAMRRSLDDAVRARDRSIEQLRILSRAIDSSPAAVVITNAAGVIQYVNPAFVGTTGFTATEAIGQTPRILNSGTHDTAFFANLWSTIQGGRIWRGDIVNRRKDGTRFEEAASIAPVMDEAATVTHFVAVTTDVTHKRAIERRLAEAERRYREIVEHSVQGFHQVTPDGRMVMANARLAAMLGYERPEELLAEPPGLWDRLHVDPQRRSEYVHTLDESGTVQGFECQLRRRDGRIIWVAENARAVLNDDGTCSHCEGFLDDITERIEAEQLKIDFISFVTHQLRTPLAGIRWMLELTERDPSLSPEARMDINDAHASALRLITLVNELLDISRLESGRLTSTPTPTDLRALTHGVLKDLEPIIEGNGQHVTVADGTVPAVMVDPQLARQSMLNFLSNAVKYTPAGGRIEVFTETTAGALRWSVRDTGIGVPAVAQKRLFEKFYRADNATSVDTEGTGLGLYLVRLIAERSGGSVSCESSEGLGSTFSLTLPLAVAEGMS